MAQKIWLPRNTVVYGGEIMAQKIWLPRNTVVYGGVLPNFS